MHHDSNMTLQAVTYLTRIYIEYNLNVRTWHQQMTSLLIALPEDTDLPNIAENTWQPQSSHCR